MMPTIPPSPHDPRPPPRPPRHRPPVPPRMAVIDPDLCTERHRKSRTVTGEARGKHAGRPHATHPDRMRRANGVGGTLLVHQRQRGHHHLSGATRGFTALARAPGGCRSLAAMGSRPTEHLETELKFEVGLDFVLRDLGALAGGGAVTAPDVALLVASYFDTADLRLATSRITLRRRTGGGDAGWHLKLPVTAGTRRELQV